MTNLTIHTDASLLRHIRCGKESPGGWAAYLRTPTKGAIILGPLFAQCPSRAEFIGIVQALNIAPEFLGFEPEKIFLRCDSQDAIMVVNRADKYSKYKKSWMPAAKRIIEPLVSSRKIIADWTPGHFNNGSRASWVNNVCDENAKRAAARHINRLYRYQSIATFEDPTSGHWEVHWQKEYRS